MAALAPTGARKQRGAAEPSASRAPGPASPSPPPAARHLTCRRCRCGCSRAVRSARACRARAPRRARACSGSLGRLARRRPRRACRSSTLMELLGQRHAGGDEQSLARRRSARLRGAASARRRRSRISSARAAAAGRSARHHGRTGRAGPACRGDARPSRRVERRSHFAQRPRGARRAGPRGAAGGLADVGGASGGARVRRRLQARGARDGQGRAGGGALPASPVSAACSGSSRQGAGARDAVLSHSLRIHRSSVPPTGQAPASRHGFIAARCRPPEHQAPDSSQLGAAHRSTRHRPLGTDSSQLGGGLRITRLRPLGTDSSQLSGGLGITRRRHVGTDSSQLGAAHRSTRRRHLAGRRKGGQGRAGAEAGRGGLAHRVGDASAEFAQLGVGDGHLRPELGDEGEELLARPSRHVEREGSDAPRPQQWRASLGGREGRRAGRTSREHPLLGGKSRTAA